MPSVGGWAVKLGDGVHQQGEAMRAVTTTRTAVAAVCAAVVVAVTGGMGSAETLVERGAYLVTPRAFCEKHGMPFGTREHTVCAEDLMDIRANERQRTLEFRVACPDKDAPELSVEQSKGG